MARLLVGMYKLSKPFSPSSEPPNYVTKPFPEMVIDWSVTKKMDPPEIVPPGPNTSKYLDPPVQLLQSSAEVFGLPLK